MSDEEWNRRQKAAREREEARLREERREREKILQKEARDTLRRTAHKESKERAEKDKKFPAAIAEKLRTYHELPDESIPEKQWCPVYAETAPFLAKCVVAYRYGNDKLLGKTEGDLGDCWGHDLATYFRLRDILVVGREAGFENLVSQKV